MKRLLIGSRQIRVIASLVALGAIGPVTAAEVEIGAVFQPEFNGALGRLVTGDQHDLLFGETVYLDETVETGPNSSTAVLFRDQTRLQVGANSRVVLDRFIYDPDAGKGEAIIDFGQGIFRFISGDMPKDKVTLRTPTAVMAIRGTTLIVYVAPDNTTQVAVISGEVGVSPCGGDAVSAAEGYSASVSGDCTSTEVVPGVITPIDPAVIADLDFSALSPAAGPAPDPDTGNDDRPDRGGQVAAGGPGGGDPGGGDPGGGDPGGGDPGGGDPGGGDPGGGDPGPGNGNGNGGNPGNGGGNTGGGGPGTGNGGPGTGNGGTPKGGQNSHNVGQNGNNAGQNNQNSGQNN